MTLSRAKITNGNYSTSNGHTGNNFVFECADCSSTSNLFFLKINLRNLK